MNTWKRTVSDRPSRTEFVGNTSNSGSIRNTMRGLNPNGDKIDVPMKPIRNIDLASGVNGITCNVPIPDITEEEMERLPFWFLGAYQNLFFGNIWQYIRDDQMYVYQVLISTFDEKFVRYYGIVEIMRMLSTKKINNIESNDWSNTINGMVVNNLLIFLYIANRIIMPEVGITEAYLSGVPEDVQLTYNSRITSNIPYFIYYKKTTTSQGAMQFLNVEFDLYLSYFSDITAMFGAKTLSSTYTIEDVSYYVDETYGMRNIFDTSLSASPPSSITNNSVLSSYVYCRPTDAPIPINIFLVKTRDNIDRVFFGDGRENLYLFHYVVYMEPASKVAYEDVVTNDEKNMLKLLHKKNKLEIISVLLGAVEPQPDDARTEFNALLTSFNNLDISERFLCLYWLMRLEN